VQNTNTSCSGSMWQFPAGAEPTAAKNCQIQCRTLWQADAEKAQNAVARTRTSLARPKRSSGQCARKGAFAYLPLSTSEADTVDVILYTAVVWALAPWFEAIAKAATVSFLLTVKDPEYLVDPVVGAVPFVV